MKALRRQKALRCHCEAVKLKPPRYWRCQNCDIYAEKSCIQGVEPARGERERRERWVGEGGRVGELQSES